jgi:RNase H-fold protein (predicted Holliday junction resolvase)
VNDQVENIMRLASLLATARVRRYAVGLPNYRGIENPLSTEARVEKATAELRKAVHEAVCFPNERT